MHFSCVVNCKAKKVSEEKLSVEGKCINYGSTVQLHYHWDLFERRKPSEKWKQVPDERFRTSTGRASKNLAISPGVLTPGTFSMIKFKGIKGK